jgi:TrkA domain protein
MTRIDETPLPGIGIRRDFQTLTGARIGVITYRNGRRELLVFDERDPEECRASITLGEQDAQRLADLLVGLQVVEQVVGEQRS